MPHGLIVLMQLQARALLRRTLRGAGTKRGVLFLGIGIAAFFLWLAPSVLHAYMVRSNDPTQLRLVFPLALLGFCLINLITTAGERAVAFSPAEVDFLFPGPFTRRQLLGYKLLKSSFAALLTSAIFSVFLLRYARWWLAAWIGVFLSLVFLQLLSMSIVFIGQTIGQRAWSRGRKLVVLVIGLGIVIALAPLVHAGKARSFLDVAKQIRNEPSGRAVLAPFDVFGQIVGATTLAPAMLSWIGVALLVIGAMLLLVFWLDAHYLETAANTSTKMYDQVRRVRRAGGMALGAPAGTGRFRLPRFPRLAGIGPIAWRQLTAATRQSRSVLVLLLMLGAIGGPIMYFLTRDDLGTLRGGGSLGGMIGIGMWMTFLFANALRFDFRGDVDQIDTLKALPISPLAIAAAQLIAPTVALAACQALLLVGLGAFLRLPVWVLPVALAVAIPFNLLLFAIENIIFLTFPARLTGLGPGDFQSVGRQIVVLFVKLIFLIVGGAVAVGVGAILYAVLDGSKVAFALGGAAVFLIEVMALLPVLVHVYKRFDPSSDTPPA